MGNFNNFIERMKREKDGFAEVWESNRPRREFIGHIEEIRIKKGMTQKELAEKVGLYQSAIARFESGESNPALKTILKIVGALDQRLTTSPVSFESQEMSNNFSYNIGKDSPSEKKTNIEYAFNWKNSSEKEDEYHYLTCEG